ncbi:MAG: CHASE domain-containing protein [Vitreoscilla sp.]|nr:CHASE domain-containing protein [Vitreoscilla sp.]
MVQRPPQPLPRWALTLGLALAYYLTARLGMALAIGPLDITAIWPPSGIALSAFMLVGVRALPGLVIGAMAMNYVAFLGPLLGWGVSAVLGSVALTCGSLLQAALVAHLCRQLPLQLESATVRLTLRFAVVVCTACVIAASLGQFTLQVLGVVSSAAVLFGWITWWVGDATGMLVIAPVALVFLHPACRPARIAAQAFPIISLGLGLTLFSTLSIGVMDRDVHIERFRSDGTRLSMALQNHIDMALRDLEINQRLFYKVELSVEEFRAVSGPMLLRSPWQQDFAYLPRVTQPQRAEFESSNALLRGMSIREISQRNTVVPAGLRSEYFPVLWTDPDAGHNALIGIDHLADPQRGPAIEKARRTGRPTASLPLNSVAQTASTEVVQVLYAPLSGVDLTENLPHDPRHVRGMVAATIDIGQMLRAAMAQMEVSGHRLLLYDPDAPRAFALEWRPGEEMVALDQAEREHRMPWMLGGIHHELGLAVADRQWVLLMQPAWADLAPRPGWLQLAVLASGLTFTALLTGFMIARRRHDQLVLDNQQALESQVQARTSELARTNQSLREQIQERQRADAQLREQIDERRKAEEQLRVFRWFAESAQVGLGIADFEYRMVYLNPALRRMTRDEGWKPGDERHLLDYLGKAFRQRFLDEAMPALRETGAWVGEMHTRARDGRPEGWYAQSHFVVKDDEGRPLYLANITTDITTQRQMEDELREAQQRAEAANRAKSMFLANMSHEIRTPLNAVLGVTQILLADSRLPAETHQRLQVILSAGNRLLGLINDVLDLAKIESGKLHLATQDFDLRREMQEIAALFAGRVAAKGLVWEADLAALPDPCMVHGDRSKIGQVVLNLLGNALKFTDHGSVRLKAWREGTDCWFEVEDTGPGMGAAELDSLFEPFSQGEAGRAKGGSGLGLRLSRDIAHAMGGELLLHSEPGVGTRARVQLPLPSVDAPPGNLLDSTPLQHLDPSTPCRVLVVEDDTDSRTLLVNLLRQIGCEVHEAADGQQGLEACQATSFNLVFSDIRMPRLNGVEMVGALRSQAATAQLPVVAVTASSLEHERRFYIENGFQDFVAKPYPFRDIYQMLARHGGARFVADTPRDISPIPDDAPDTQAMVAAREVLTELQAAAAEGDMARVKRLLGTLAPAALGRARIRSWEELARRYDFSALEAAVQVALRQSDHRCAS